MHRKVQLGEEIHYGVVCNEVTEAKCENPMYLKISRKEGFEFPHYQQRVDIGMMHMLIP